MLCAHAMARATLAFLRRITFASMRFPPQGSSRIFLGRWIAILRLQDFSQHSSDRTGLSLSLRRGGVDGHLRGEQNTGDEHQFRRPFSLMSSSRPGNFGSGGYTQNSSVSDDGEPCSCSVAALDGMSRESFASERRGRSPAPTTTTHPAPEVFSRCPDELVDEEEGRCVHGRNSRSRACRSRVVDEPGDAVLRAMLAAPIADGAQRHLVDAPSVYCVARVRV